MAAPPSSDHTARPEAAAPFMLVSTKLAPPRLREQLVRREALLERLRQGRGSALTLVCAPAGYGKTTLLAQWEAADHDRTPFAWVSLDESDSDPVRLWSHLIVALWKVHGAVGEQSLPALAAGSENITGAVLPLLLDELSGCPPIVLVLDDWQAVKSRVCNESVGALVERAHEEVQIVVASRADPGLPIARLRAHGDLTEVRGRDLRVSPDEAEGVFEAANLHLSPRDVRRLTRRTEGWLAGLTLATIVLQEQTDRPGFVHRFSGDSRHVFDYLERDVFEAVRPDLRDFMIHTSILDRLSGPLCDAVLETSDSAATLAELERSNLFVVSLDDVGSEYRYHQLFRAMLARELVKTDPDSLPGLHLRAAEWYEEHGELERAIEHAIAGRDVGRASELVTRVFVPLISVGRVATVRHWLESLSWPKARANRQLAVARALTAGLTAQGHDQIERWLVVAGTGTDEGPLANGISSLESAIAMIRSIYLARGIADAERSARLVLDREPAGSEWRYAGLVPLGQALYLSRRKDEAKVPLEAAIGLPGAQRRATTVVGLSCLALIALDDGDAVTAERLAREGMELAVKNGHSSDITAVYPHLALGCVLAGGSDLHAATEHIERAVELALSSGSPYWHAHALLRLAALRHHLGEDLAARDALALAKATLDELPDVGMLAELHAEISDALQQGARREGFLGDDLSAAESRVLEDLVGGLSIAEIARKHWLSPNTVKSHRRSIYRKLGVTSRDELFQSPSARALLDPARDAR